MDVAAVIFDMDGLLLDTERLSIKANQMACRKMGFSRDIDHFTALAGKNRETVAEILSEWTGRKVECDAYHQRWKSAYNALTQDAIDLRPTVLKSVDLIDRIGLPKAIATTTEKEHAVRKLAVAGLDGRFQTIIGFHCVQKRKPAPDPYLAAAAALSLDPSRCVAFEDSDTGVRAALAAKMTVVQVPDVAPALERRAHFRVESIWEGLTAIGVVDGKVS
ncbi:HAD family hydrolase [Roseibium sp. SCP14]|uniref:HAD family hydrolase n=1 Tax=Roseibium sp. SCP14 TaxID=3141375 RepID=UPI00333DD05D